MAKDAKKKRKKTRKTAPGKLARVKPPAKLLEGTRIKAVPLEEIERKNMILQYRVDAESVTNLVKSFQSEGQLVPVTLWSCSDHDKLIVVDGHRRVRAAEALGIAVLAVVRDDITEEQAYRIAFEENMRRQGYGPLDRANAVQMIRDRQGVTIEQAAAFLDMSRSAAGRLVKLLDLPSALRRAVGKNKIRPNHALLLGQHPGEDFDAWVKKIEAEELGIRQLRKLLNKTGRGRKKVYLRRRGGGFQLTGFSFRPGRCAPEERREMLAALKRAVAMLEEKNA